MKVIEAFIYESNELSDKPWGSVDKSELLKAVIDKPSLAEKIYLKIEPNWQEKPSERLSYPIADKNGTVYRYGLSSAMTYAKANNETEVINKLKKLYKKYGIDENCDSMRKVVEAVVNESGKYVGRSFDGDTYTIQKCGNHYVLFKGKEEIDEVDSMEDARYAMKEYEEELKNS